MSALKRLADTTGEGATRYAMSKDREESRGDERQEFEEEHGEEARSKDAEGETASEARQEVARRRNSSVPRSARVSRRPPLMQVAGTVAAVRRLISRINAVTLVPWVLAAGMAAVIIAEYVSERM